MATANANAEVLPAEREHLSAIIDRLRTGQLSLWRLHADCAPYLDSTDPGVAEVANLLISLRAHDFWTWPHRWDRLHPVERESIDRCRCFLGTALPYEWPAPPPTLLPDLARAALVLLWLGALGQLTFALALVVIGVYQSLPEVWLEALILTLACAATLVGATVGSRALRAWTDAAQRRYTEAGDPTVWPFLRRADYDAAGADGPATV